MIKTQIVEGLEVYSCLPARKTKKLPVLFVHGAFAGGWMWTETFMPFLAKAGYPCYALSLRGHGGSHGRDHLDWHSITDYIADVKAVVDSLRETPVLVGHSMGGCASQEAAFLFPERVTALALFGSPSVTEPCATSVQTYGRFLFMLSRLLPEKILVQFMQGSATSYSIKPEVQTYIRETTNLISKTTFRAIARSILNGYHDEPGYVVKQPFLLTHGDQDSTAIMEQAANWAKREPYCQYTVVPNAGHNANQDNSEFFTEILQGFLLSTVANQP